MRTGKPEMQDSTQYTRRFDIQSDVFVSNMHFIIAHVSHLQNEIRMKQKAYGAAPEVLNFRGGGISGQ
ncbi:uncharacterized [Tachysurus ichikawai]